MTATTVDINLPPLAQYQIDAIFAPKRHAVIEASTKAGKTVGCMYWMLSQSATPPKQGAEYWWVAPIYPQTKIAFTRMKNEVFGAFDPKGTYWTANESELFIRLANGAVLRFKSADKPDGLYGEDVYAAVMDEASRIKRDAWYAVRSTLTATRGPVRIIGNVKGRKTWAFQLGVKAKSGDDPNWSYAKITAADAVKAGILTQDEIDAAERELPHDVFRELYYAEPSDGGGNPFGLDAIARCVREGLSVEPVAAWGVDLAKSTDWTVAIGLDRRGQVAAFERWQGPWSVTRDRLVGMLRGAELGSLVDSTGVGDPIVEDLQRAVPNVEGFKFSQQSKQQIMLGLASVIQRGEVGFPDGILRDELDSFEYVYRGDDSGNFTGVSYSAPDGQHDDAVCALALAVRKLTMAVPFSIGVVTPKQAIHAAQVAKNTAATETQESVRAYFDRMRKDPNWGFN